MRHAQWMVLSYSLLAQSAAKRRNCHPTRFTIHSKFQFNYLLHFILNARNGHTKLAQLKSGILNAINKRFIRKILPKRQSQQHQYALCKSIVLVVILANLLRKNLRMGEFQDYRISLDSCLTTPSPACLTIRKPETTRCWNDRSHVRVISITFGVLFIILYA